VTATNCRHDLTENYAFKMKFGNIESTCICVKYKNKWSLGIGYEELDGNFKCGFNKHIVFLPWDILSSINCVPRVTSLSNFRDSKMMGCMSKRFAKWRRMVRQQQGKIYIMRICITMLLNWHKYA